MTEMKLEMSDSCTCNKVDDEGNEVKDEQGNPVPSEWCNGCWEFAMDDLDYMLGEWLTARQLGTDTDIKVGGDGLTWQRRSGWTIVQPNAKSVIDRLSINGDWTLRFTLEGENLSVVRYSHDEPMGTGELVFSLPTDDEVEYFNNR